MPSHTRNLILVLGDQLDRDSSALQNADLKQDAVWMAEVAAESEKVWVSKPRIAIFLASMRHFRNQLREKGWQVHYRELGEAGPETLAEQLEKTLKKLKPQKLIMVGAGEWQVGQDLAAVAQKAGVPLELRQDTHFLCTPEEFQAHAKGRKQLRLEFFYREMRQRTGFLMAGKAPEGGEWNYDAENRESFGKQGPANIPAPQRFLPDAVTTEVLALVNDRFAKHPGSVDAFDWPVTEEQAEQALADFIEHRLADFGQYQDAMWTREPWLYHSRLSAAMNVKLLHPRKVIAAAEEAYRKGDVPLPAVEGFIRQILGWREYVRGVYWLHMPGYLQKNALQASEPLPQFYWTGDTPMNCLRDALGQTLKYGYAHHIQRLMVTGLYSLLLGVDPKAVHEWYLAVYVDAVEWVELPNTLGMSQYGDGGIMASKPYIASGKYIQRMSNYCQGCRFNPAKSTGADACPFTTLYWDFLMRHEPSLAKNPRMGMQVRNLKRLSDAEKIAISTQAQHVRDGSFPNPAEFTLS
jgi:deoxyribodipyrimidine photolyase-related protein